jgi:integrase
MARPAEGWVKWRSGKTGEHWYCQVTLKTGKRSEWIDLDPKIPESDRERAKTAAKQVSDDARLHGFVPLMTTTETVNEYATRWIKARTGRVRSVGDNECHLEHHVLPVLGTVEIARVTRADVERLVGTLDTKVRQAKLAAKTARNVWGTVSKMFDDATNAKPAEGLRCLEADPSTGVRPPDGGPPKLLQFLYPSEFAEFIASEDVPRRWKRNAAIAVYLCLRAGEQAALKWPAVDLEHGVVTIQERLDRLTGEDREGSKGGAARMVPIHPHLLPVLRAMHEDSGGKGYVCKLPNLQDIACGFRRWLKRAGIDRDGLHRGTSVSKPLRWHDLRATGLTWYAVEGRSSAELRDIAGHTQSSMTDRYVRAAGVLRGGRFGAPFPPLPAALGFRSSFAPEAKLSAILAAKQCEGGDLNPYRSYPTRT